jgi:hypothetical protein
VKKLNLKGYDFVVAIYDSTPIPVFGKGRFEGGIGRGKIVVTDTGLDFIHLIAQVKSQLGSVEPTASNTFAEMTVAAMRGGQ